MKRDADDKEKGSKPTLEDIEKHLCKQDRETKRAFYFSGYAFGGSLVLLALTLLAGKGILLTGEYWFIFFCIILFIGGSTLAVTAWLKQRKLRDK